jgi:3-hydroxy-9,10-secoandrosta-1,3,5(10)-triene-9,17-dione monooxygenase
LQSKVRAENTAEGQKALRAALMAKATSLVPLLRAKGAETERERRIPDEILAALDAAQIFRLRAPKRYGGLEGDLRAYMDVVTELGRGCGSTSWIGFISIATAWIAALFPDEAQHDVFDGNPDARFMGVLAMTTPAKPTDGGYMISGKWSYASNCLHAHWAILAVPLPGADGAIAPGIVLVPMRDLKIEDTWHVVAMRGTGSHTVIANEVFVPAHRVIPVETLAKGESPRTHTDELVYRESFMPTAIIAVAAPVLGLAQAALDLTLERISGGKPIAYSFYDDLRKAPSMQIKLAEAATLIETAVLHVRRWCDDISDAARAGEALPFAKRAQMRMDLGYAMRCCRDAVDLLLSVQGASAFAESNPIQRVWRDLEMASRHGLVTGEIPQEIYGRALVGNLEPLSPFV